MRLGQAATLDAPARKDKARDSIMIHSMTAFARESAPVEQAIITVELRAVNHRYLDLSFKMPDPLRALEPRLREAATKRLGRGKVECMVRLQGGPAAASALEIDPDKLQAVLAAARQIQAEVDDAAPVDPLQVLQFPGIARGPETSEEVLQAEAFALHCFERLPRSEVARRTGRSRYAVRTSLERLRRSVAIDLGVSRNRDGAARS